MARKAPIIHLNEFKGKCLKILKNDYLNTSAFNGALDKDLKKVLFSWENHCTGTYQYDNQPLLGFKVLKNGLPVLVCYAGGDWEYPVHFIIYWDGKMLRGYIPEEGNTFDKEYKTAYGSQEDSKLYQERYGKLPYGDPSIPFMKTGEDVTVDLHWELFEQDIISRIQITANNM